METKKAKRITLATVKAFIRRNQGKLFINIKHSFDGQEDGIVVHKEGFQPAVETTENLEHSMGINGAWFVGGSRDYFTPFKNEQYEGHQIANSCGMFILAVKNQTKVKRFRIFNSDKQTCIGHFATTEEVYNEGKKLDVALEYYFIDCTIDDIEVPLTDFLEMWESGERPEDLQMF